MFCIPVIPFSPSNNEEEKMITRFHGIDPHKKYSTISLVNRKGEEQVSREAHRTWVAMQKCQSVHWMEVWMVMSLK